MKLKTTNQQASTETATASHLTSPRRVVGNDKAASSTETHSTGENGQESHRNLEKSHDGGPERIGRGWARGSRPVFERSGGKLLTWVDPEGGGGVRGGIMNDEV